MCEQLVYQGISDDFLLKEMTDSISKILFHEPELKMICAVGQI